MKKTARPDTRTFLLVPTVRSALVLILCLAVAPALAIIAWSGLEYGAHLTVHARLEAQRQADAFAEIQTRITQSAGQVLATLAALPAIRSGDSRAIAPVLQAAHAANPGYLNLTLVDAAGIVVASSRLASGTDLSGRAHIRSALAQRRFFPGDYFRNLIDDKPSIAYSQPVLGTDGRPMGVLNAIIALDSYGPLFDRLELPENSFLGIVDRTGIRMYFHPPKATNPVGEAIKPSVWAEISGGDDRGIFNDVGSDGVSRLFSYKALTLSEGLPPYMYVVYSIPDRAVTAVSRAVLLRNLLFMAGAGLVAVVIALFLSARLFGTRLAAIIETTSRIASGDLASRCGIVRDGSDLGRIAASIDDMATTIQLRDAETGRYARTLAASLAEKETLIKEVHHRVKNNLQMIIALIRLQEDADIDPAAFRDSLEKRISSIAVAHEMLHRSDDVSTVDLGEYSRRLLSLISESIPPAVSIDSELDPVSCGTDKAISFGLLLNELVVNAYKHAFADGRDGLIRVLLKAEGASARFEVSDDGPGLPPGFELSATRGLGLRLVEAFAERLGGTLSWGNDGPGARFTVAFPIG